MISKREKYSLVYFLSNSFFLASGYSIIFKLSGKDSWISMIIGSIIGSLIIYIFNKLSFNKKNNYILNEKINVFKKGLMSVFFIFILFINVLIVRIFATSFFLNKTPGIFITIPFITLSYLASKKGLSTISKMSEILMPISLTVIFITMIAVIKDGTLNSFIPLLTTSKIKILLSSLYFAIFTSIPQLLLFDIKIDEKNHIKYYFVSSIITALIGIEIIYILGPYLIKVFRFPEYMVLKQIKLFNFIEKIENLIGLIWFFNLFICSSICLYNLDKLHNDYKLKNYLILAFIICLIEIVSNNYEYAIYIYKHLPIILFTIGFIFFLTIYKVTRKIKKVAKAT